MGCVKNWSGFKQAKRGLKQARRKASLQNAMSEIQWSN
jgi:hypothetical protein